MHAYSTARRETSRTGARRRVSPQQSESGLSMRRGFSRHGGLLLAVVIGGVRSACAVAGGPQPLCVQSRVFDVEYAVNEAALPLDSVQLWYTLDRGTSWRRYGFDEDRQSPISFHASSEGLYGFFVVLANAAGWSSAPPSQGNQPHQWAFVDYTPPVVQLHELRRATIVGRRALQIRWTAIDTHLTARPVEISYRRLPDGRWRPLAPDPLANTGRYDWRLPDDLFGPLAVRLAVRDQGGHRVSHRPSSCRRQRRIGLRRSDPVSRCW